MALYLALLSMIQESQVLAVGEVRCPRIQQVHLQEAQVQEKGVLVTASRRADPGPTSVSQYRDLEQQLLSLRCLRFFGQRFPFLIRFFVCVQHCVTISQGARTREYGNRGKVIEVVSH